VDIPLLSEHQAPDQGAPEPDANDYEPSEQDEKDIRLVEKLFLRQSSSKRNTTSAGTTFTTCSAAGNGKTFGPRIAIPR
jgi:hypothetical protein